MGWDLEQIKATHPFIKKRVSYFWTRYSELRESMMIPQCVVQTEVDRIHSEIDHHRISFSLG